MTDAKHVENLPGLPEDKSLMPEWSTAARFVVSRRVMGAVSCLDSSEPADCQSYEAEKLHGRHSVSAQVVNSCKAQEEIYVDQKAVPATVKKSGLQIEAEKLSQDVQTPSTVLVWIDGAWSGEPVSCKPLFAGAGRPNDHAIDTPRLSKPMGDVGLLLEAGPRH